jgi:hypothetical protein
MADQRRAERARRHSVAKPTKQRAARQGVRQSNTPSSKTRLRGHRIAENKGQLGGRDFSRRSHGISRGVVAVGRRLRRSFQSGTGKLAWATVSVVALILGLYTDGVGLLSRITTSEIENESRDLFVLNPYSHQEPFTLYSPDGQPTSEIRWRVTYVVENSGDTVIKLEDFSAAFPAVHLDPVGNVRLVRTSRADTMTVYDDLAELDDAQNSESEARRADAIFNHVAPIPVPVGPGQHRVIQYEQSFQLDAGGEPKVFDTGDDLLGVLAPYLGLGPFSGGGYQCMNRRVVPTEVRTSHGTMSKDVNYFLFVVGCKLLLDSSDDSAEPSQGQSPSEGDELGDDDGR